MKDFILVLIILIDGCVIGFNLQLLKEIRDLRYKRKEMND